MTNSTNSSSNTASSKGSSRLLLIRGSGPDPLPETLYRAGFAAAGIDTACESRELDIGQLGAEIARIRTDPTVMGVAVMMPLTIAVSRLLDGLGPEAQAVKAVNTVSNRGGALIGWNTDRAAFLLALDDAGYQPKGKAALVLGAGGAARAVADGLRTVASTIWVASRELDDARALCHDLDIRSGGPAPLGSLAMVVRKVDLIVNATPVGTDGVARPFPIEWIAPTQFVFDLVYHPPLTPLVRGARERGARAVNGLRMLLNQGLAAFEIWTGQPAPEPAMRAALERAVVGRVVP
ncbi:MAG TPA: shikimate dehydrogenase [Candidatus Dormibacteraeota bacterium]